MRYIKYLFHGRAGEVGDVIIDTLGVMVGVVLIMIIVKIKDKRKREY